MKIQDVILGSLLVILVADITNSVPVQFPSDESSSRSLQPDWSIEDDSDSPGEEPRFHHHKQKIKKKKKKKLACLLHLHHNRQKRSPQDSADPRTLWWGAVNYYDTDVYYYGSGGNPSGAYPYQQQGSGNPCEHFGLGGSSTGLGSQIINVVGGLPGFGNNPGSNSGNNGFPGLGGVRPPILPTLPPVTLSPIVPVRPLVTRPPAPIFTTPATTTKPPTGGGDNSDEDYDYSEGYPSTNSYSRPSMRPPRRRPTRPPTSPRPRPRPGPVVTTIGQGLSSFGDLISSVPAAAGTVISSFGSGVRPVFERSERYIDDYVVKPLNDSVKQLVRWFR